MRRPPWTKAPYLFLKKAMYAEIEWPKIGIEGFITVELIDAKTGKVKQRLDFPNLIVDAGLDGIGNGTIMAFTLNNPVFALTQYMGCGTGSTTPATTDVALVTEIAPASSNRSASIGGGNETDTYNASPEYIERAIVREFTTAQANGNLTECGLFSASSAGTMFMRQLFKDGVGNPTTITKTSNDLLRITYRLRMHPPASDATGTVTINSVTYNWTLRPLGTSTLNHWGSGSGGIIGGLLGTWAGTDVFHNVAYETDVLATRTATAMNNGFGGNAATSISWSSYTNGTFFRDLTSVFSTSNANFATGIGGMEIYNSGNFGLSLFQEVFSPKIPKDNTKQLTMIHRISWGRFP